MMHYEIGEVRKRKVSTFQPDRNYVEKAIKEFKEKGGKIRKVDSNEFEYNCNNYVSKWVF